MAQPRILVCRSPHQASALADQLVLLGAQPILIPTIELVEPTTFLPLDEALTTMESFDWLLFTSGNAVDAFARRGGVSTVTTQKIGAIGPATAKALVTAGLRADVTPPRAVAESLAEALLPFAHRQDGRAARFLLVRAEVAREALPETLRAAGADVVVVAAYRTVVAEGSVAAVRTIFATRDHWPDAICFTSSSSVRNLVALLEEGGLKLPAEVLRVSIGPITSATLRDEGFPPHAESVTPTILELASTAVTAVLRRP